MMVTSKLNKLQQIMNASANLPRKNYTEVPIFAVQLLIYLAIHGTGRAIHASELIRVFDTYEAKIYRACREHLSAYITAENTVKEGVKCPVKAFRLSKAGEDYINALCELVDN